MSPSFDAVCESILADLLSLRERFPHFRKLDRSSIRGTRLDYRHGHREVPNPNFDPNRKHKVRGPYAKTLDQWDDDGIRLFLSLDREHIDEARGSAPEDDPDWADIELSAYREDGTSYARVGPVHVTFQIQGNDPDGAIRKAVLEIFHRNR